MKTNEFLTPLDRAVMADRAKLAERKERYMSAYSAQRAILAHLMNGGVLTVASAWRMFGTSELRKYASRFRRKGLAIQTRPIEVLTSDGRKATVNEYSLLQVQQ